MIMSNQIVLDRCAELGLSLRHVQRLAAAAHHAGAQAFLWVQGLVTFATLKTRRWLSMAAQTSNVSYRGTLTAETLLEILTIGEVPAAFSPHVRYLLNEASIQILVMVVEQAAQQSGAPIETIWCNVDGLRSKWSRREKSHGRWIRASSSPVIQMTFHGSCPRSVGG